MDTRFHCVYLLTSGDVHCAGMYYIGYTVHPLRRLRQHNGELLHGAAHTSRRGRPWLLVCCVSGFVEDRAALRFEWCWQHPDASARLRHSAAPALLHALRRTLPFAVGVLHALLRARLFARLALTLHIFDAARFDAAAATARAHVQQQLQLQSSMFLSLSSAPRNTRRRAAAAVVLDNNNNNDDSNNAAAVSNDDNDEQVMPALTTSALLRVEHTTHEAFDAAYLSHDRSLHAHAEAVDDSGNVAARPLRATSVTASAPCSPHATLCNNSCPYDVMSLSQSVLDECSCGSMDVTAHTCSDGDDNSNSNNNSSNATTWRVPVRFRGYRAADYVQLHMREQRLLSLQLLPCTLCGLPLRTPHILRCVREPHCHLRTHLACLAMWFHYHTQLQRHDGAERGWHEHITTAATATTTAAADRDDRDDGDKDDDEEEALMLVPSGLPCACPLCGVPLRWCVLVRTLKHRARVEHRLTLQRRRWLLERRWQRRLAALAQRHAHRRIGAATRAAAGRCRQRLSLRAAAETMPALTSAASDVCQPPQRSATQPRNATGARAVAVHDGNNSDKDKAASDATVLLGWTPFDEREWLLPR